MKNNTSNSAPCIRCTHSLVQADNIIVLDEMNFVSNKKKEATHGITLIRELFHHLPELQPNINNKVWYFIRTSPLF